MPTRPCPAWCWERPWLLLGMEHCRLSQVCPWRCCRKTTGKEAPLLLVSVPLTSALDPVPSPPPVPPPHPRSSVVSTPATPGHADTSRLPLVPWAFPHLSHEDEEQTDQGEGLEAEPGAGGPPKERGCPRGVPLAGGRSTFWWGTGNLYSHPRKAVEYLLVCSILTDL